ncbi:MAG: hypothetical protein L0228_09290 [Planctomycetes bacterium]|nr:hypothetical protein [Planctomycetota bacterium]
MFHLEWRDVAISDLANGWLKADSRLRADITSAIHEVERRLLRAPDRAGESRIPGTRVLILNPLVVTFHVNVRTNIVLISAVRVNRRGRNQSE